MTSCAAGQHAQTAYEKPTPQDFAYGNIGALRLRNVAVQAPDRLGGSTASYPSGAAVPLTLVIVNTGARSETLRKVSSPAFSGWGVYATGQLTAAASGSSGTSSSTPAAASSTPTSPSVALPSASLSSAPASSTGPSLGGAAATSVTVAANQAVALGVVNQTGSDTRSGADVSAQTIVMTGLHGQQYAPLFPAAVVPITFTFAHSGSKTLQVPVQLTAPASGITVPTLATVPNGG
jgi:hypothetical protein